MSAPGHIETTRAEQWFRGLAIAVVFLLIWLAIWFGLLFPLTPASPLGWAIEIGSGFVVLVVGWGIHYILSSIDDQRRPSRVLKLVGYIVAPSLGITIFVAAYFAQGYWAKNFSYFFR